jgi:hypothetical protein
MFVFDTSAYINGRRDHFFPKTFPSVWKLVSESVNDGRIICPRAVYREVTVEDDDVASWIQAFAGLVVEPSPEVQHAVGPIQARLPNPGTRDGADPFVIAEAQVRELIVVTYEGRSFSGVATRALAPQHARALPALRGRL